MDILQTNNGSLADRAAQQITEKIISGEFKPGAQIPTELALAESLNVSRTTVREAVKQLAARNVLQIRRGQGTFVSQHPGLTEDPFGLEYVQDKEKLFSDMLSLRLVLEPWIASEAASNATQEDIAEIWAYCRETEQKIFAGLPFILSDEAFHMAIARSTQNMVAPLLMPVIRQGVSVFGELTNYAFGMQTVEAHRKIAGAIEDHDPKAAAEAMQSHIILNRDNIRGVLSRSEEPLKEGGQ